MAKQEAVQTAQVTPNGKMFKLEVSERNTNVSWKYQWEGNGAKTLIAETHPGGRWMEVKVEEVFFPYAEQKKTTVRTAYITLTRASATELHGLLGIMLSRSPETNEEGQQ